MQRRISVPRYAGIHPLHEHPESVISLLMQRLKYLLVQFFPTPAISLTLPYRISANKAPCGPCTALSFLALMFVHLLENSSSVFREFFAFFFRKFAFLLRLRTVQRFSLHYVGQQFLLSAWPRLSGIDVIVLWRF